MNRIMLIALTLVMASPVFAEESVVLGNDVWPPFILEGADRGTAEELVCQALERAGRSCAVRVDDWDKVLEAARTGSIDGIAAAWLTPEREEFLLFSEPYLTNRIVPVIDANRPVDIKTASDLAGLRVALVRDYAYGEEIDAVMPNIDVVNSSSSEAAIQALRDGRADAALVDELVARDLLEEASHIISTDKVLAFRSLHFAVSLQNPQAQEIIDDFHRAYEAMLSDGSVNEILNIDWLATDFGQPGQINLVLRSGVSLDDLSNPSDDGSIYALEDSEYQVVRERDYNPDRVKYQVGGESYSSLQSALNNVFGKQSVCEHKEFKSEFDCTNLFRDR